MVLLALFFIATCVFAGPIKPPQSGQDAQLLNSFDADEFNNGIEIINNVTRNTDPYRLNTAVYPQSYTLSLRLEQNFGTTQTFTGTVKIAITFQEATNLIQLHSKYLTIPQTGVELYCDNNSVNNLFQNLEFGEEYEMLYVSTQSVVPAGSTCELSFTGFSGVLADDMYGFYRSSYLDENGQTVWIATTQFQATHARRAFPCFDEPSFKATFDITLTHPPGFVALTNTPEKSTDTTVDGLVINTYETTPLVSSYLLAFVVAPFIYMKNSKYNYRVFARSEAHDTLAYSFAVGPPLLESLENFTDFEYLSSGIGKLDQVAIPDFSAGAMENWGLVTYREALLLWDSKESTNANKQRIATVISHEFAHKWFGNLVTCEWWSNTWLNEGFARYFEYFTTGDVETTWQIESQFVVEQVLTSLATDSLFNTASLTSDVSTPAQVSGRFTLISYNKGATIIRMIEHIIGHENFKQALQTYISQHAYGTVVPQDLWNAFEEFATDALSALPESRTIAQIMNPWTVQSGYPVLNVSLRGADAVITQQRFLINPEESSNNTWDLPITYTTSHGPNFANTTPSLWLFSSQNEAVIENVLHGGTGWILLNIQATAFYRVNYENQLWLEIEKGLKSEDFDGIDVISRTLIVDDVFNLARARQLSYTTALDILSYLESETEYYPWHAAFTNFNFLRRRIGQDAVLEPFLKDFIGNLMEELYRSVPFSDNRDDDQIYSLKKNLALTWACRLEFDTCVEDAVNAFEAYRSGGSLNANIKSVVYCTVLRHSDTDETWRYLWNKYTQTKLATEQVLILNSLGCTRNESLLNEYLQKSISGDSGIRRQDASSVFASVYDGNPDGVDIAFDFLTRNYVEIANYYGSMNGLSNLITGLSERFTTEEQVSALESFLEEAGENLGSAQGIVQSSIEAARANIRWTQLSSEELRGWFTRSSADRASISLSAGVIAVLVLNVFIF